MKTIASVAAWMLTFTCLCCAETISVNEHNFAIDIPDGWQLTPAPSPAVAAAADSNRQKFVVIIATSLPEKERATALRDMGAGARDGIKAKGWPIVSERRLVNNKLSFDTFTSRMSEEATVNTWITVAGDHAYSVQAIHKNGNAETDPELQKVLTSFRLLSPSASYPTPYTSTVDKNSFAYRLGHMFGSVVLFGFFIGGIIWIVRRFRRRPDPPTT